MRPASRLFGITGSKEGDRVTTLELLFDLVFAFTQVTGIVTHGDVPLSFVDGYVVLSLLWFSWGAFSWLANEARADAGVLRWAFIAATITVFVACLALPDAFRETPGLNPDAVTLVVCYAAVRVIHAAVYLVAARSDARLRRQVTMTVAGSLVPTLVLLGIGVALGSPLQRWVWLAAMLYDFAAVFITAQRAAGWQVRSAAHFAERHGLVVILALGESVVAIGAGLGQRPLEAGTAVGGLLSIVIAVGLWYAYFLRIAEGLETAIARRAGQERAKVATDVFTYLHFLVIAGIILAATGIETAMGHLGDGELGWLGAAELAGGVALFLAATAAAVRRADGPWLPARLTAALVLVAGIPALAAIPPLAAVGATAALIVALTAVEARTARLVTARPHSAPDPA